MSSTVNSTNPAAATILRNGGNAALVAAVVNGILFYIGNAINAFPADVITPMGGPITIGPVVLMTVVLILLGTLAYMILARFTAHPNRWFIIAAIVVFVLFLPGPITLADAPISMMVLLEVMHVVAAGSAVYFLARN